MVSSQNPFPFNWNKHSLQWHPHGAALGNAHSFVSRGGGKALPLPQCCTLPAHEEATLHCVSYHDGHCCHRRCRPHPHCDFRHRLHCRRHCRYCRPLLLPLPSAITIAVAVSHHHHRCRWPSQLPLPLPLLTPLPSPSLSAIGVAIAVASAISPQKRGGPH